MTWVSLLAVGLIIVHIAVSFLGIVLNSEQFNKFAWWASFFVCIILLILRFLE